MHISWQTSLQILLFLFLLSFQVLLLTCIYFAYDLINFKISDWNKMKNDEATVCVHFDRVLQLAEAQHFFSLYISYISQKVITSVNSKHTFNSHFTWFKCNWIKMYAKKQKQKKNNKLIHVAFWTLRILFFCSDYSVKWHFCFYSMFLFFKLWILWFRMNLL